MTAILNYEKLASDYLLSNSPSFLINHYRSDDSVKRLSNIFKTEQLIDFIDDLKEKDIDDLKIIVALYSYLVALTFKNDNIVHKYFAESKELPLEWYDSIKKYYLSKMSSDCYFKSSNINMNNEVTLSGHYGGNVQVFNLDAKKQV